MRADFPEDISFERLQRGQRNLLQTNVSIFEGQIASIVDISLGQSMGNAINFFIFLDL